MGLWGPAGSILPIGFVTFRSFVLARGMGEMCGRVSVRARVFTTDKSAFLFQFGISGVNYKDNRYEDNKYTGQWSIGLGYQYHFYKYKRISVFFGLDASFEQIFSYKEDSINGFSIYIGPGIDFYVYRGLYVGAKINAGIKDVISPNGGHILEGGIGVNPLIRLGWKF